jgi:hypothetical protein
MLSNRHIISQVRNKLGGNRLDDRISNHTILTTLLNFAALLIRRDSESRKLFSNSTMIVLPDCIELEEIDSSCNCLGIVVPKCRILKKSVNKLPDFFISNFSLPLIQVTSVDESTQFHPTTSYVYSQSLNREFVKRANKYFWIEDGYLVIANEDIEAVKVKGYFKNYTTPVKRSSTCKTYLDGMWNVPDYLTADILKLSTEDLFVERKIPKDENSNLNSNSKQ